MKKQTIFRYLAAACFFVIACMEAHSFSYGFDINTLLPVVLNLAVSISLLLRSKLVSAISFGGLAIYYLYLTIYFIQLHELHYFLLCVINFTLWMAAFLLLLFASLSSRNSKKLGIAAAAVIFVKLVFNSVFTYSFSGLGFHLYFVGVYSLMYDVINIAGAVLVGFTLWKESSPNPKENKAAPAKAQPQISSSYETLIRLKSLVDSGTITQEEFDAKKKQLLGL